MIFTLCFLVQIAFRSLVVVHFLMVIYQVLTTFVKTDVNRFAIVFFDCSAISDLDKGYS